MTLWIHYGSSQCRSNKLQLSTLHSLSEKWSKKSLPWDLMCKKLLFILEGNRNVSSLVLSRSACSANPCAFGIEEKLSYMSSSIECFLAWSASNPTVSSSRNDSDLSASGLKPNPPSCRSHSDILSKRRYEKNLEAAQMVRVWLGTRSQFYLLCSCYHFNSFWLLCLVEHVVWHVVCG